MWECLVGVLVGVSFCEAVLSRRVLVVAAFTESASVLRIVGVEAAFH